MATKKTLPPRWADRFLTWYCSPHLLEDLQGDLHERFEQNIKDRGAAYARFRFLVDVFSFLRPYVIRRSRSGYSRTNLNMFRHYLKVGIRNIKRDKKYLVVNSLGLAVGAGCALVLIAYVFSELSYDRHFTNGTNIYRISCSTLIDNNHTDFAPIPPAIGLALKEEIPEVASLARIMYFNGNRVRINHQGEILHQSNVFLADSTIFDVFSFTFLAGDKSALRGADRIVLTSSLAKKLFGPDYQQANIIDRAIDIEDHPFFVGGVIEDVPFTTHFQPSAFIGWHGYGDDNTWNDSHAYTYALLKPGTEVQHVQRKLDKFVAENENIRKVAEEFGARVSIYLDELLSIHLHSTKMYELSANGNINYIYALSFIAIFFLTSSGINYTNIAIASSLHRAREIGVRKTMGALRHHIRKQFLIESAVMIVFAFIVGLGFFYLLIPYFNELMSYHLTASILLRTDFCVVLMSVVISLCLIASFYPAVYVSALRPVDAIKNVFAKGGHKGGFRKTLLIGQFAISSVMILAVIAGSKQMQFVQNKSLGFDKENILLVQIPEPFVKDAPVLKEKILSLSGVESASVCGYYPGLSSMIDEHRVERSNGEMKAATVARLFFDHDYLSLLGLKVIAGRNFERERESDYGNAYLVNEAAVKAFGWDHTSSGALGRRIEGMNYGKDGVVIGVVQDVNLFSLKNEIEPLIMNLTDYDGQLYVKLNGSGTRQTISQIEDLCKEVFGDTPPEFHFLDDRLDQLYQADERLQKALLIGSYALIFISCLGLFGLSAFMISQRTKEIGVRKTFGASVGQIIVLLSKDYLVLIVIANACAIPIGYYLVRQWLETYAYHVDMSTWILGVPLATTAALALVSVGYQLVKGSRLNPVDSLKHE